MTETAKINKQTKENNKKKQKKSTKKKKNKKKIVLLFLLNEKNKNRKISTNEKNKKHVENRKIKKKYVFISPSVKCEEVVPFYQSFSHQFNRTSVDDVQYLDHHLLVIHLFIFIQIYTLFICFSIATTFFLFFLKRRSFPLIVFLTFNNCHTTFVLYPFMNIKHDMYDPSSSYTPLICLSTKLHLKKREQ